MLYFDLYRAELELRWREEAIARRTRARGRPRTGRPRIAAWLGGVARTLPLAWRARRHGAARSARTMAGPATASLQQRCGGGR